MNPSTEAAGVDLDLTELQLEILCLLWSRGEATVAELHKGLARRRDVSPSTIHTILSRLEDREVVTHRSDGKRYWFAAAVERDQVKEAVIEQFCHRTRGLFQGSLTRVVDWLLRIEDVDPADRRKVLEVLEAVEPGVSVPAAAPGESPSPS